MHTLVPLKVDFLYLFAMIAGLPCFGVSGRAMNISNAWFLPQEGFPVFYRYFGDRVTWTEAEATCGLHHANLLSVQTSSQMDAARVYLREIDVTDNIWIGLHKESPEQPFSWTNDEKLSGDGYWAGPIPKTGEKLCVALDPAADYRWSSHYCRGPQVASFVCELPVPEWAKEGNGCLVTSLPSLTVTFIPEVGVIQLMSDCGLDGMRVIACNGEMNREEVIRRLSCDMDASTIFSRTTTDAVRELNTQKSSTSEMTDRINRQETGKTYPPQTRHRRNANLNSSSIPQEGAGPPPKNPSFHGFLHSPNLSFMRNASTTRKPPTIKGKEQNATTPPFKDLPVLIITGEKLNESASATSENPQIVLMIENKDLSEPFLVPLSDDLDPSSVIDVDLVEVDNLTSTNQTTSAAPPKKLSLARAQHTLPTTLNNEEEENSNTVEDKEVDVPQRPNRGRLLTHSSHPSFYPRFLNRVLG